MDAKNIVSFLLGNIYHQDNINYDQDVDIIILQLLCYYREDKL